jgi:hypothetical protein
VLHTVLHYTQARADEELSALRAQLQAQRADAVTTQAAAATAAATLKAKLDSTTAELMTFKAAAAADASAAAAASQSEVSALRAELLALKTAAATAVAAAAASKAENDRMAAGLDAIKAQAAADAAAIAAVKDEKAALLATTQQQQQLALQAAEVCIAHYPLRIHYRTCSVKPSAEATTTGTVTVYYHFLKQLQCTSLLLALTYHTLPLIMLHQLVYSLHARTHTHTYTLRYRHVLLRLALQ